MDENEYVQSVVLLRSGSHEEAIRAVAESSVRAWLQSQDDPAWAAWLSGPFVKSVRRAKAGAFWKLAEDDADNHALVQVGDAAAIAYTPTRYADMNPVIAKLQVSGTDFQRAGWTDPEQSSHVWVVMNDDLGMSTGKAAAQAAHALFAYALQTDRDLDPHWQDTITGFHLTGVSRDKFAALSPTATVLIQDAGRTEVEPGSATALAMTGSAVIRAARVAYQPRHGSPEGTSVAR